MYNSTTELLPMLTCILIDIYGEHLKTTNPSYTVTCHPGFGAYLAEKKTGLLICAYLCSVIWCVGICGIISNVFNLTVLHRSGNYMKPSFKLMLITLAWFEMAACFSTIFLAALKLIILANISRNWPVFYLVRILHIMFPLSRSAAFYQTILISIERLLAVAYPLKSKIWLTPYRSKLYMILIHCLTIFANLNWIFGVNVVSNSYLGLSEHNPSIREFPYILVANWFEKQVLPVILPVYQFLDYILPFIAVLTLNGLLYWKIHSWNKERKMLSPSLKGDIKTAKMFAGVTIILLICHAVAFSALTVFLITKSYYREMAFLYVLSVTVSSSVNILFYQTKRKFREELDKQVQACLEWFRKKASWNPFHLETLYERLRRLSTESGESFFGRRSSGFKNQTVLFWRSCVNTVSAVILPKPAITLQT